MNTEFHSVPCVTFETFVVKMINHKAHNGKTTKFARNAGIQSKSGEKGNE